MPVSRTHAEGRKRFSPVQLHYKKGHLPYVHGASKCQLLPTLIARSLPISVPELVDILSAWCAFLSCNLTYLPRDGPTTTLKRPGITQATFWSVGQLARVKGEVVLLLICYISLLPYPSINVILLRAGASGAKKLRQSDLLLTTN